MTLINGTSPVTAAVNAAIQFGTFSAVDYVILVIAAILWLVVWWKLLKISAKALIFGVLLVIICLATIKSLAMF